MDSNIVEATLELDGKRQPVWCVQEKGVTVDVCLSFNEALGVQLNAGVGGNVVCLTDGHGQFGWSRELTVAMAEAGNKTAQELLALAETALADKYDPEQPNIVHANCDSGSYEINVFVGKPEHIDAIRSSVIHDLPEYKDYQGVQARALAERFLPRNVRRDDPTLIGCVHSLLGEADGEDDELWARDKTRYPNDRASGAGARLRLVPVQPGWRIEDSNKGHGEYVTDVDDIW